MSSVGEGAPGEILQGFPPADSMEVVNSADSGPVGEAKADVEAQEGPSCAAASEPSASAVGTGAKQAAATTSVEDGASGVAEELTKVRHSELPSSSRGVHCHFGQHVLKTAAQIANSFSLLEHG